ncbi:hypothetical protein [Streptomyces cucumeris]|uniref:hypothetical protein n=1 Tax=Streptomyces cucumeris TaxID=2962890 RepID=UPI0020C908A1|nr:hypothetical protein [Streptomyces sp. NEAU-Y11]MCP9209701.1 hypothetical protein [Streptomyces sp. NEAU-Y11]
MSEIAVLIPYGNETPWRRRALDYTLSWYAENLENPRTVIGFGSNPWCKATAVADALARSTESVIIVADADCVSPGVKQAVRIVQQGANWAMPHLKVYRMSPKATERIHEGVEPGSLTGQNIWLDQSPYKGYEGGGITVLRRDAYLDCPLDPAFTGWGQEDEAWATALNGLHGAPWRGAAPLYHLWHEKPARMTRYAGSADSLARLQQYKMARTHEDWSNLLKEARSCAQRGGSRYRVAI